MLYTHREYLLDGPSYGRKVWMTCKVYFDPTSTWETVKIIHCGWQDVTCMFDDSELADIFEDVSN